MNIVPAKISTVFLWQLNAWDEKHIEEPAYEIRLAGFSEAKQALQNPQQWSVNSVLPVLHNAMFFLLQVYQASFPVSLPLSEENLDMGLGIASYPGQFQLLYANMTAVFSVYFRTLKNDDIT